MEQRGLARLGGNPVVDVPDDERPADEDVGGHARLLVPLLVRLEELVDPGQRRPGRGQARAHARGAQERLVELGGQGGEGRQGAHRHPPLDDVVPADDEDDDGSQRPDEAQRGGEDAVDGDHAGVGAADLGGRPLRAALIRGDVRGRTGEEVTGYADALDDGAAEVGHGVEHAVGNRIEAPGDLLGGQDEKQGEAQHTQGDDVGPGPHDADEDAQVDDEPEALGQDARDEGLGLRGVIGDAREHGTTRSGADGGRREPGELAEHEDPEALLEALTGGDGHLLHRHADRRTGEGRRRGQETRDDDGRRRGAGSCAVDNALEHERRDGGQTGLRGVQEGDDDNGGGRGAQRPSGAGRQEAAHRHGRGARRRVRHDWSTSLHSRSPDSTRAPVGSPVATETTAG